MKNRMQENTALAKKLNPWAYVLSIIILIVVFGMKYFKIPVDEPLTFLPPFHSAVNALTGIVLIIALYFVKKKNIEAHKKTIMIAMGLSFIFLLSYVTYHITTESTNYCGEGISKLIYFILLITHILSAAIIFPFILFTFIKGFTYQVEKHKRMARWVFPVWLYVCFSGPICYLMLAPCY